MSDTGQRFTKPDTPPTPKQLESWLGKKAFGFWRLVEKMISEKHPGVFVPEWLYGGKKNGWSIRYKKSKSFCTMIPEKGRCLLLIVFGAEERAKVETIREELSAQVQKAYDEATTYHDGKWLLLNIDSKSVCADAEMLLTVKRTPKHGSSAERTGRELTANSSGKQGVAIQSGAESGALGASVSQKDPRLTAIIGAWPTLPEAIKAGILAMIRAADDMTHLPVSALSIPANLSHEVSLPSSAAKQPGGR